MLPQIAFQPMQLARTNYFYLLKQSSLILSYFLHLTDKQPPADIYFKVESLRSQELAGNELGSRK